MNYFLFLCVFVLLQSTTLLSQSSLEENLFQQLKKDKSISANKDFVVLYLLPETLCIPCVGAELWDDAGWQAKQYHTNNFVSTHILTYDKQGAFVEVAHKSKISNPKHTVEAASILKKLSKYKEYALVFNQQGQLLDTYKIAKQGFNRVFSHIDSLVSRKYKVDYQDLETAFESTLPIGRINWKGIDFEWTEQGKKFYLCDRATGSLYLFSSDGKLLSNEKYFPEQHELIKQHLAYETLATALYLDASRKVIITHLYDDAIDTILFNKPVRLYLNPLQTFSIVAEGKSLYSDTNSQVQSFFLHDGKSIWRIANPSLSESKEGRKPLTAIVDSKFSQQTFTLQENIVSHRYLTAGDRHLLHLDTSGTLIKYNHKGKSRKVVCKSFQRLEPEKMNPYLSRISTTYLKNTISVQERADNFALLFTYETLSGNRILPNIQVPAESLASFNPFSSLIYLFIWDADTKKMKIIGKKIPKSSK